MAQVVICDIDGVISDCTERFRTLYEGKFQPVDEPVFMLADQGEVMIPRLTHAEMITVTSQEPARSLIYIEDTGEYIISDGQHLLKDCSVFATDLVRNPDWQPDWERFHDKRMDKEPVHQEYVALLRQLSISSEIHLVTARSEVYRKRTIKYLDKNQVPYHRIHMRHEDQGWENSKQTAVLDIINEGHQIMLAIDDDGMNKAMFESFGIPFLHVVRGHHDGEVLADN